MEPPWVGGTKICSRHLGHMTTMAATPTYGKNPSNDFYSGIDLSRNDTRRPCFKRLYSITIVFFFRARSDEQGFFAKFLHAFESVCSNFRITRYKIQETLFRVDFQIYNRITFAISYFVDKHDLKYCTSIHDIYKDHSYLGDISACTYKNKLLR